MAKQLGVVVGIDKNSNNEKIYRIIIANIDKKGDRQYNWGFSCKMMLERQLKEILASGQTQWLNIEFVNGQIKGKPAALSRFEDNKNRPLVILSQLVSQEDKVLGYRVATYDGKVKNIPLKEMLAYGNRISKTGGIPVQNAMFVSADTEKNKKEHYKSYPDFSFIQELLPSNTNNNVNKQGVKRVQLQRNEKTLSKLDEIYTKPQLKELQAGKKEGLDIRIYANPELSAEQMHELMKGLKDKVNVKPFAHPEYDVMAMRYYIDCLKNNIDIRPFLNPEYNIGQISELALAVELGLDISKMCKVSLKPHEMAEIRERLESKIWKDELVNKDGSWQ